MISHETESVRIPKYGVRISPQILTTDPRPQADAMSDPLSLRESATRFLTLTGCPQSTHRRVLGRSYPKYKLYVTLHSTYTR